MRRSLIFTPFVAALVLGDALTPARVQVTARIRELTLRARADSVVAKLVTGINRRDAALVAALTSHPGEQPYVAAARDAIDDFRHYGLRVHRSFQYTIHGSKAGSPVEHRVQLIHGDGLVGWRDRWVPPPSD